MQKDGDQNKPAKSPSNFIFTMINKNQRLPVRRLFKCIEFDGTRSWKGATRPPVDFSLFLSPNLTIYGFPCDILFEQLIKIKFQDRRRSSSPMEKIMIPPHRARKSLGQNFLTDPSIAQRIVEFLDPSVPRETPLIEIGPGKGILTKALLNKTSNLILLEKDHELLPSLTERFGSIPGVRIIRTDALDYPFGEGEDYHAPPFSGGDYRIVSNLPYNISVPLLFRFLSSPKPPMEMILMFQREVAGRIVASTDSDEYGHLSVAMALSTSAKKVLDLKPGSFHPAPKVHSSVVVIRPKAFGPDGEREQILHALNLSRKLFSYRRRTLQNALHLAFPESLKGDFEDVLDRSGVPQNKRVERLLPEEFLTISREIETLKQNSEDSDKYFPSGNPPKQNKENLPQ